MMNDKSNPKPDAIVTAISWLQGNADLEKKIDQYQTFLAATELLRVSAIPDHLLTPAADVLINRAVSMRDPLGNEQDRRVLDACAEALRAHSHYTAVADAIYHAFRNHAKNSQNTYKFVLIGLVVTRPERMVGTSSETWFDRSTATARSMADKTVSMDGADPVRH